MFLAYVGKGYQGMQRNPGAVTIEDELERAIVAAGGISPDNAGDFTKVQWMRAARTDKGVSAVGQSISLRMMLEHPTDKRDVITRINEKLPEGFEFFGYTCVTGGFNAKTMCDRRRHEYVIPTKAFDPRQRRPRAEIEAEATLAAEMGDDDAAAAAAAAPFVFDEGRDRVTRSSETTAARTTTTTPFASPPTSPARCGTSSRSTVPCPSSWTAWSSCGAPSSASRSCCIRFANSSG